jgi:hypothetical protein
MAFDLRTHIRDSKGKIVQVQPYRVTVENGQQVFERPPGSGKYYAADGARIEYAGPPLKQEAKQVPSHDEVVHEGLTKADKAKATK